MSRIIVPEFALRRRAGFALKLLDVQRARARAVDGSDIDPTPQSGGLYATSLGLSHTHADDHEMLCHGLAMHDAPHAGCRSCRDETHPWPPRMT